MEAVFKSPYVVKHLSTAVSVNMLLKVPKHCYELLCKNKVFRMKRLNVAFLKEPNAFAGFTWNLLNFGVYGK